MKIRIIAIIFACFFIASYALAQDNLSPSQRKALSSSWLDAGKTYYTDHKTVKARECFKYSNGLYPMGADAGEARDLLKKYFNITVTYDPDKTFREYIIKAENLDDPLYKLNNLLMALEIKQDSDVLYAVAVLYNRLDNRDKASDYLNDAIKAGYPRDSVDPGLKDLIK